MALTCKVSVSMFPQDRRHCAQILCTLQWYEVKRYMGTLAFPSSLVGQSPLAVLAYSSLPKGNTMRIVLSRKGFDSSSGGCPSPILPDGRLRSLPIPELEGFSGAKYSQIYSGDAFPTGAIVEALTKGKVRANSLTHFDPDIDRDAVLGRHPDWLGVFGQSGRVQGHLKKQKIEVGDLFLFFGLARQTEGDAKTLQFVKDSPPIHTLWGWLQIGDIVKISKDTARKYPQFKDHPHVAYPERTKENTIYIGKKKLEIGGITKKLPGYGTFPIFDPRLQLTVEGKDTSVWCLPQWFERKLSWNPRDAQWSPCKKDQSKVVLHSTHRGQEFVIDLGSDAAVALEWLQGIFDCAQES